MPTAQFLPDLAALHQRLAWCPDHARHSLDIRIASAADGVYAYINNAKPIRLSDISAEDTEVYVRQLSAMLVHYPTLVRINNRPVATEPYRDKPSMRVSKHDGSLLYPQTDIQRRHPGQGLPRHLAGPGFVRTGHPPGRTESAQRLLRRRPGVPPSPTAGTGSPTLRGL